MDYLKRNGKVKADAMTGGGTVGERDAEHFRRVNVVLARMRYEGSEQQKIDQRNRALDRELNEIANIWRDVSASRRRPEIYRYLGAVLDIYRSAKRRGRSADLICRARLFSDRSIDPGADVFTVLVRSTAGRRGPDAKQVSKLVRVLRYAAAVKKVGISLRQFARELGGINGICGLYASRLGRGKAKRKGK
jgi:hypothetical protein